MVFNVKQLHGSRRVRAPSPFRGGQDQNDRVRDFDLLMLRVRGRRERNASPPRLLRDEREDSDLDAEASEWSGESSSGDSQWESRAEQEILHQGRTFDFRGWFANEAREEVRSRGDQSRY